MANPLLEQRGLPQFRTIKPEDIEPAIDDLLESCRLLVDELLELKTQPRWADFVEPIDAVDDKLARSWSAIGHLNAVLNSDELRQAYNSCLPKISDYATEMGQNRKLYRAYKYIYDNDPDLDQAQTKRLKNALRDFHLSGIDLDQDKQKEFKRISQKLSTAQSRFNDNLLDATQGWTKQINRIEELTGLPQSAIDLAKQQAQQRGLEGWLITLNYPSYFSVMTYAENPELRQEVYRAHITRASDQGPQAGSWDNSEIMEHILNLRYQKAQLLGMDSYVQYSLQRKMASEPDEVLAFLNGLVDKTKPQAEQEYAELCAFAKETDAVDPLKVWDIGYYSEKLKQQRYRFSQEEVKDYFPVESVIEGLFKITSQLFGLHIRQTPGVETWHQDVSFYTVYNQDEELCGQFYMDLFARLNKRGGAWMDECISRLRIKGQLQYPVAFLTCNFTPPVADKPSMLTHAEVETLFHEFGHVLHHILTKVDYSGVNGINGVAWDAVELPSQFLENWCWEPEALKLISSHYQTGELLPESLFRKMLKARHFQPAMMMIRQLELSLFDFELHQNYEPTRGAQINQCYAEVRNRVAIYPIPKWGRFANGFGHIFSGGYAAGYYSYKWAEVLSADAYSRFEDEGIFNPQTGQSFKEAILEKGGSLDAMQLFIAFRGRKPSIDALLRHSGIIAQA